MTPAELRDISAAASSLLGPGVRVAAAACAGPIPPLWPQEEAAVVNAVDKRRREFAVGRNLARTLIAELGFSPAPIPRSADRSPAWPTGVTGSITHTDEVVVVAVARATETSGFGVDIEGSGPLDEALWPYVLTQEEVVRLGPAPGRLAKVVFSAKEAFYKAQHPHTGALLDFLDVELCLDVETRRFAVSVRHPAGALLPVPLPQGAWAEVGGHVLTAVRF